MKLFLISTFANVWIVRADSISSAIDKVDPQGYIKKHYNIEIKELVSNGSTDILFYR